MRLTCPECDAQYQVEDALIPPDGRSVECARCGHLWHQPGRATEAFVLGESDLAPELPPAAEVSDDRPRTSAKALEILREEAQRELAQRAADRADPLRGGPGGTSRTEAAAPAADYDDQPRPSDWTRAGTPRDGYGAGPYPHGGGAGAANPRGGPHDRPELVVAELVDDDDDLPALTRDDRGAAAEADLAWPGMSSDPDGLPDMPAAHPPPARTGRPIGYPAGFGLAAAVCLLAVALYASAPASAGVGPVSRGLAYYKDAADAVRLQLHGLIRRPGDDPASRP